MTKENNEKDICCPEFNPIPWDEKLFEFKDKKFIKDSVFTIFYMPVNYGSVMKKFDQMIREANAEIPDNLCLSDHTSKWNMDLYLAVDQEISGAKNSTMSGTYASKVYEGPFSETGKWHKDFISWCNSQEYKTGKIFTWYTTCPKCAKKYGKNYVVLISEISKS